MPTTDFGPQHDFRANPETRKRNFLHYIGTEMDLGFEEIEIWIDPVDERADLHELVIEIPANSMEAHRFTPEQIKERVQSLVDSQEIVADVVGMNFYKPDRYEVYGWEVRFYA